MEGKKSRILQEIKEYIVSFIVIGGIAILIYKFIAYGVYIPSPSMVPTLNIDDRLIITRVYKPENLKSGDIITFKCDEFGDDLLIKRLIGLPGDTIEIKDGIVYRNGNKLDESYVKNNETYTNKFIVPDNKYLCLGDNRAKSDDSRYWKNPYVDAEDIQGEALFRIYPFNRIGLLN